MSDLAATFERRLAEVRERIDRAAGRSGRSVEAVKLLAVSKAHPAEAVLQALDCGVTHLGENRVLEAVSKAGLVTSALLRRNPASPEPDWHLIGHLQTNKVRAALGLFVILHAVDSERLLRAISGAASGPISVMIEVNIAAEPQKYGIAPGQLPALLAFSRELPNIAVRGLMTVAPLVDDPERVRPVFRELRTLAQQHSLPELSMGMTGDYEVAIEEGATMVRVGRALFGERQ